MMTMTMEKVELKEKEEVEVVEDGEMMTSAWMMEIKRVEEEEEDGAMMI
jgi:hypothetical protein